MLKDLLRLLGSGSGVAPHEPRRPRTAGTRAACAALFALAIGLAGAASKAVRGMSAPVGYEPILVRGFDPLPEPTEPEAAPEPQLPARPKPSDQPPPPPRPVATSEPKKPKPAPSTPSPAPPTAAKTKPKADEVVPPPPKSTSARFWIRDRNGRRVVSRVYSEWDGRYAVMLPDGEIGFADGAAPTDEPFVPLSMDALERQLKNGEYADFKILKTKHYLVFYGGTDRFAAASADLLESLYTKLSSALLREGFSVHESEFPLVAVIYANEEEFRARKKVASQVQAYYEILSNRIFLYESSAKDKVSPETSLLRKPQTVAHEGSHQLLQNIGVQPRLADWPLWLVEGFAEYCSPPKITKTGVAWAGLNQINPLHMATIRDLDDPLSTAVEGSTSQPIRRNPNDSWVRTLVAKSDLTPTDYALSWALTSYLANKRLPEFLDYLKEMSKRPPLQRRTGEDHLKDFERAFGKITIKTDGTVASFLSRLKKFDALPYYAVMFEQQFGAGVRRASIVSQSPQFVQQWVESMGHPQGAVPRWQAVPHPTRARALLHAQQWMMSGGR